MTYTTFLNKLVWHSYVHLVPLICLFVKGTGSYKKPLDLLVWSYSYLEKAHKAPPFFSEQFDLAATAALTLIDICRDDITIDNATIVYKYLVSLLSWFHMSLTVVIKQECNQVHCEHDFLNWRQIMKTCKCILVLFTEAQHCNACCKLKPQLRPTIACIITKFLVNRL